jgi:hypothetical protein
MSYESEQADIHTANTMISSWHNCPCNSCRERQSANGFPLARFSNESDADNWTPDELSFSAEPPF